MAQIGEQKYTTLAGALEAANTGDDKTVTLLASAALAEAIPSDVTVTVPADITLTVNDPTHLASGGLEIAATGKLMLGTEAFVGGTDARLNLTSGSVTMQGTTVTLTANSAATIPSGENFYLMLGSPAGSATRLQAVVDTNATLTIDGTLTLPSGTVNGTSAKLTVNGTVNDNGLIRANSGSAIDGTGTIHVNNGGKLTVHTSTANGNAAISVSSIALSSGGEVYSELTDNTDLESHLSNYSKDTAGGFTVDGVESNGELVQFSTKYTYYVPTSSSGSSGTTRYTVSVPSDVDNGTVTVSPSRASRGSTVTVTVTPDEGYELDSLTVTDSDGNALTLTDKGDGKYTFTMPRGAVSVAATFKAVEEEPQPSDFPFTDVAENAWYYDAVVYAWENDLMTGTSATLFAPGMTTDRAMLATLLWRLEGEPVVDYAMSFTDVAEGLWYSEAVRWAASEGVVNGVGDGSSFAPTGAITREQMAAMLYRYAQYKGYDVTGSADLSGYADADSVSGWAEYAVAWAVGAGLISGVGNNTLNPQGSATRAEIATILMRFAETFVPAE